jgi:hypothetical protein
MKRINHSYLYFFILAALSLPEFAMAQTSAPIITPPARPIVVVTTVAPSAPAPAASAPVASASGDSAPAVADLSGMNSPPSLPAPTNRPVVTVALPAVDYYRPASAGAANEADSILSPAELKKAGLSLSIDGMNVQLNGSLPTACAENLVMDVSRKDPEDTDGDLSTLDDLNKQSSIIGIRVTFKGNDSGAKNKAKTLADCMKAESGSGVEDVSSLDKLKKPTLLSDDELARVGFEDKDGKIGDKFLTSNSYNKLAKVMKFKDCPDCKVDPTKISSAMDELGNQSAATDSLRSALMEKAIADANVKIEKADSIKKIESVRSDLLAYADEVKNKLKADDGVDKDKLSDEIDDALGKLQSKTGELAYGDQKHADKYADQIVKNAKIISSNPNVGSDLKDQQGGKDGKGGVVEAYSKGGSMRLDYISAIYPDAPEVRDYLNNAANNIHNAQQVVNKDCKATMFNQNRINSNACQQAIASMQALQTTAEQLATKYMAAQKMPQNMQPTLQNSVAYNGTDLMNGKPVKGYFLGGNGAFTPVNSGQTNGQIAQNNVFGLPSYMAQNSGMYVPGSNSSFQVTAPNYTGSGQYQISNSPVAVPLQQQQNLVPNTPSLGSFGPQYQYSING